MVDSADPAFERILVWADANADRISTPEELKPLAAYGVVSLELSYWINARCNLRRNCEVERAHFTWRAASGQLQRGQIVDIHLTVHDKARSRLLARAK